MIGIADSKGVGESVMERNVARVRYAMVVALLFGTHWS